MFTWSWLGAAFLTYGVTIVSVFIFAKLANLETRQNIMSIPGLNLFVNDDSSEAGHTLKNILLVYGIFTLFHGTALMIDEESSPGFWLSYKHFIEHKYTQNVVYSIIGGFMIGYFSAAVAEADFMETKYDRNYMTNYKTGIAWGFIFLMVLFYKYFNIRGNLSKLFKRGKKFEQPKAE
jgi:hypothetical protein